MNNYYLLDTMFQEHFTYIISQPPYTVDGILPSSYVMKLRLPKVKWLICDHTKL